jgi:hypothetical protein
MDFNTLLNKYTKLKDNTKYLKKVNRNTLRSIKLCKAENNELEILQKTLIF